MATWTEKEWKEVLIHLNKVIGDDSKRYESVVAAQLTAAIPYLAGSEDPDRFAVSNLLTFHAATKARELFDHRRSDDEDLFRRLATFHVGNHADPKVVDHGLTLLALISLADHEHDAEEDRKTGKYNPINAGKWNLKALREELEADVKRSPALGELFAPIITPAQALSAPFWT